MAIYDKTKGDQVSSISRIKTDSIKSERVGGEKVERERERERETDRQTDGQIDRRTENEKREREREREK